MHMHQIVICGLSGSASFFHIISQTTRFRKKKLLNIKCVYCFLQHVWNISHTKNWAKYDQKLYWSPCKVSFILGIASSPLCVCVCVCVCVKLEKMVGSQTQLCLCLTTYHFSKYPLFLSELNKLNFLDRISKNIYTSNFVKVRLLGAECSRRTDMTKLIVAFSNFSNAPKNVPTAWNMRVTGDILSL